jgi:hypothetical protein
MSIVLIAFLQQKIEVLYVAFEEDPSHGIPAVQRGSFDWEYVPTYCSEDPLIGSTYLLTVARIL